MAVIYLGPKNNPLDQVGPALQGISGIVNGIMQARQKQKEQQVLQKIVQEPDPGKQSQMALQALGVDKGGELIQKLTQIKMNQLGMAKAQLENQKTQLEVAGDQESNKEQPEMFKLTQQKAQSEQMLSAAERAYKMAAAAGVTSEAAKNYAEIGEAKARTGQINDEIQRRKDFSQAADAFLKGAQPNDTLAVPGPNGQPQPAPVQPKHVASIYDFALGKTKNVADVDLPPPDLAQGSGGKYHLSPQSLNDAKVALASGDQSAFLKAIGNAGKIVSRSDKTLAPGFKLKVGVLDDGTEIPLGNPRYEPNKANLSVDSRTAQGIALWNATVEGIRKISEDPKIANQGARVLMDTVHNVAPYLDIKSIFGQSGKDYYDWKAQAGHALIAAAGLMSARTNQALNKSLSDTIPKISSPNAEIAANLDASMRITDTMANDLFGSLIADGKAIPEELKDIIKKRGLAGRDSGDVGSEGLGVDGAKTAPAPGGEGGGAGETSGGGATLPAAPEGASTPPVSDIKQRPPMLYDTHGNLIQ